MPMPITWASPAVRGGEAAPGDWEQGKNPAPGGGMEGVTAGCSSEQTAGRSGRMHTNTYLCVGQGMHRFLRREVTGNKLEQIFSRV